MQYFNSLPFITTTDNTGNVYALRNILVRTNLIPQLAGNPLLFYAYSLQDGDTPEIVAHKYYGDVNRFWITLYGNPQIMDPQSDWPLSSQQFLLYLQDKYAVAANGASNVVSYTQGIIQTYQKVITTYDNYSQTTVIKTVDIDETSYYQVQPFTQTQQFPDGSSVTYTVSTNTISLYDYEYQQNEAKRNINLINATYANQVETQYQSLVSL